MSERWATHPDGTCPWPLYSADDDWRFWVFNNESQSGFAINCEVCAHNWPDQIVWFDDKWARSVVLDEWPNVRFLNLAALNQHEQLLTAFSAAPQTN